MNFNSSFSLFKFYVIILCTVSLVDGYHFKLYQPDVKNITRYRRQTNCENSFKCQSGECIPEENQCDGRVDCTDESDETDDCKNTPCVGRQLFRCTYGACISKDLKCNGARDCRDNSDENLPECRNTRPRPATIVDKSNCNIKDFECDSGQCIDETLVCDGEANCDDNSDETAAVCTDITCPSKTTFTCAYGACVHGKAKCDGVKDCFDGSDENCGQVTPVTPVRPTPTVSPPTVSPPTEKPPVLPGSCVIPPFPSNGVYVVGAAPPDMFKPGDYVRPFGSLGINCDRKYKPSPPGSSYSLCLNGNWNPLPSTCSRACPPISSTKTTKVKCKYNGRRLDNCDNPIADTIAEISCEPLYEEPGLKQNPSRVCRDGTWDYPVSQCYPICGQKRPKGTPSIINGTTVVLGDYPWQVGVYTSGRQHICGGAVLNKRVILSAAHCFADREGRLLPKENYLIAAGKYFRQYDDPRDTKAQYSTVDAIYLPERYKGSITDFEADIAIVILTDAFDLSESIQPVCIDLSNEFENQQLIANSYGVVTGWGFTREGEAPAEELKELQVPFIPYDRCYDEVPKAFRKFITYDKICAGYSEAGAAACGGDSGGALVFPRQFNDRYFVRGIVSTSPATEVGRCDSNQYGAYTLVSKHLEFVNDLMTLNREN